MVTSESYDQRCYFQLEASRGPEENEPLCPVDVQTSSEFLSLIDKLGPYICLVETHIDISLMISYEGTVPL